jgi:CTP:molybdopterin cytidylyltransferase MocA
MALGESTLIEYQIEQVTAAGVRDVEVVLGYEAERVIPLVALDGVEAIIDANWRSGEVSSLRVGAAAVPRGTDLGHHHPHRATTSRIVDPFAPGFSSPERRRDHAALV